MEIDGSNAGRNWRDLKETNNGLIVLDMNDQVVSCNEKAKNTLLNSHSDDGITLPLDCFWLETDQRVFYLNEFKHIFGKMITLLLRSGHAQPCRVKVLVEELSLAGQLYCSLLIQEDQADPKSDSLFCRSQMAQALSTDLKDNVLELHYQPQINTADTSLYGVEVLSRWASQKFGRVSPDDFIAVAEEFGFIAMLDLWVLTQACQQLVVWREQGIQVPLIAVNFSPLSFNYPNLKETIQSILLQNRLLPSDLVLEVTENKKVVSLYQFTGVINELYAMGIQISLDDFGTGYSNLKRLLKFPVSQLKLDRSFVMDLPHGISNALSETVFSISQKIGAVSIAEGVETELQFRLLKEMGYEIVQGYLFSPPVPKAEFDTWYLLRFS